MTDERQQIVDITAVQQEPAAVAVQEHNVIENYRDYYKLAQTICTAAIIPQAYQNKPADVAIAIDMADRMGVSPMMVMQSMFVVKGKPS